MTTKIVVTILCGFGLLAALALHFTGHRPEASAVAGVTCVATVALVLVVIGQAKRR